MKKKTLNCCEIVMGRRDIFYLCSSHCRQHTPFYSDKYTILQCWYKWHSGDIGLFQDLHIHRCLEKESDFRAFSSNWFEEKRELFRAKIVMFDGFSCKLYNKHGK